MADQQIDLQALDAKIQTIKEAAEELKSMGENNPALARNAVRILASTKMLEINISDLVRL
ncbi:MAG: hypothetical protein JRH13_04265 [Deltaproteobacteria bacterium]|nr:hypothetical protein [Deltaproteobacteria bacterium]